MRPTVHQEEIQLLYDTFLLLKVSSLPVELCNFPGDVPTRDVASVSALSSYSQGHYGICLQQRSQLNPAT